MVLETESYNNGGYQRQRYSAYYGPNGGYNSYQSVTDYSSPPYSGWSSGSDYYGNGANHHLGGVPVKPIGSYESSYNYENSFTDGNTNNHGNPLHQTHASLHGSNHQSHGSPHSQVYGGSHSQGHESPHGFDHRSDSHHQGHNIPQGQGYGSPHEFGKTHGVGAAITHQINKLTHGQGNSSHANYGHNPSGLNHKYGNSSHANYGHNPSGFNDKYGNSSHANYGHNPSGFSHGYQKPSWTVKGFDDDDE